MKGCNDLRRFPTVHLKEKQKDRINRLKIDVTISLVTLWGLSYLWDSSSLHHEQTGIMGLLYASVPFLLMFGTPVSQIYGINRVFLLYRETKKYKELN